MDPSGRRNFDFGARGLRLGVSRAGFLGLALVVLAAPGCHEATVSAPSAIPVTVLELGGGAIASESLYSGRVRAATTAKVRSQVEGVVEALASVRDEQGERRVLQEGDRVSAGQVLVRLETDAYEERVGEARAKLDRAKAEFADRAISYTRMQEMYANGQIVSKQQVDDAKAAYESTKAEVGQHEHGLAEAEIYLGRTKVKAPISGVVLAVAVAVGDVARSQTLLLEIGDLSSVDVSFGVPAALAARLELGMRVHFYVDGLGDREFVGRISKLAPAADVASGVFNAVVRLPNPSGALRPGQVAEVRLPREFQGEASGHAPLVPLDAIVRPPDDPEAFAVYVVGAEGGANASDGRAELRRVDVGNPVGNLVAIESGLEGEERVILRGATIVHDGSPVRVIP